MGIDKGLEYHAAKFAKQITTNKIETDSTASLTPTDIIGTTGDDVKNQDLFMVRCATPIRPSNVYNPDNEESTLDHSIEIISQHCDGFVIPLQGKNDDEAKDGSILGAILVGHGGRLHKSTPTKKPIFISVGHGLSLQEAVELCCHVSLVRVPEPVRQADLIGRSIIAHKKSQ